jgi:iron complex transport system substrate-binding protein
LHESAENFVTDSRGAHIALGREYIRVISLAPNMTEIFSWISDPDGSVPRSSKDAASFARERDPDGSEPTQGATSMLQSTRNTDTPRLVAVSEQCDWPERIKTLPRAGSLLMPDYERIAKMKPDIVLASYEGNPPALADFLKRARIPLYAARIDSIAALYTTLTNLSLLFFPDGNMDWENSLTENMRALENTLAGERIFFQIGSATQAWSFGRKTLLHDLTELAGAQNLGASRRGLFPQFNGEALARLKPSLVILLSGSDHKRDINFWNQYAPEAKIHAMPPNPYERPGPRLIQALLELSAL